jgi:hypothetical protein
MAQTDAQVADRQVRTGGPRAAARNHRRAGRRRTCAGGAHRSRATVGRRIRPGGRARSARLVLWAGRCSSAGTGRMKAAARPARVRVVQRDRGNQTRSARTVGRRSEGGPRWRGQTQLDHRLGDRSGNDHWDGCRTTTHRGHAGSGSPGRARRSLLRPDGPGPRRPGGFADRPRADRRGADRRGAGRSVEAIQRRSAERSWSSGAVDPA